MSEKGRAAIYCRVSDRKQVDRYSLDVQDTMLRDYATQHEMIIADVFIEKGKSAKSLDRPELQRCLTGVTHGRYDALLCLESDRLTRSVPDMYRLMEILHAGRCQLIPILEPTPDFTTSDGIFTSTIRTAINERERRHTRERVLRGMTARLQQGRWNGGTPPYGYTSDTGALIPDPDEADTLRWIFAEYLQCHSLRHVATLLNAKGIPTKRGSRWHATIIRQILMNPVYVGKLTWGKRHRDPLTHELTPGEPMIVNGIHEALISQQRFDRVQAILQEKARPSPRATRLYVLSGLVWCGLCGSRCHGTSKVKRGRLYAYYRCRGVAMGACSCPTWRADELEQQVIDHLTALSDNMTFLEDRAALLQRVKAELEAHQPTQALRGLDTQIADHRQKLGILLEAMLNKGFDDPIARAKYDTLQRELVALEAEYDRHQRRIDTQWTAYETLESSLARLQHFGDLWAQLEDTERPEFLRNMVDRVVVTATTTDVYLLVEHPEQVVSIEYYTASRSVLSTHLLRPVSFSRGDPIT